jgi:hypothetical protein
VGRQGVWQSRKRGNHFRKRKMGSLVLEILVDIYLSQLHCKFSVERDFVLLFPRGATAIKRCSVLIGLVLAFHKAFRNRHDCWSKQVLFYCNVKLGQIPN